MTRKIALITGATSGIGEATARIFAKQQIDLIICGRRKERLQQLKEELSSQVKVRTLAFDVGDQEAVAAALNELEASWRAIDILVNNAGNAHGLDEITGASLNDWNNMIDFNVKGLLYVSKIVIDWMVDRGTGHIINVSSIAGKQTYAKGTVYCASKSAVESISKGMRLELVPKGIKVTNIAPGAVETEFSEVRFKGDKARAQSVYANFVPLVAHDIADAIYYCCAVPDHVQIADMTIFPKAQSDATTIIRSEK